MSVYKKLAGQTAIYGLSSIIGRFLNYLLVPLHTSKSVFSPEQYGIITEMYAYVAFLVILLTYGMETAFFRFSSKSETPHKVFSTTVVSVFSTTILFIVLAIIFAQPTANWLMYPSHQEYVIWFAIIVGLDALTSIPLARLREQGRAMKFAFVTMSGIAVNIGLNLFFLMYCMPAHKAGVSNFLIDTFYNPEIGVGYVFIANLVASIARFVLLLPDLVQARYGIDKQTLKLMLRYGAPLLVAGLAGVVNETIDRILLKRMLYASMGEAGALREVGIYGAFYKISIVITLFIQAFRYAAEPFFFAQDKQANAKETYAKIMTYFVVVCAAIFLGVMLFLEVFHYFIPNDEYWTGNGVSVVPILLLANVCLGIYYNQSIWYKLSNRTHFGAFLALGGAMITICLNLLLIPILGFLGSAWATLACYFSMMIASYFLGQKYFPVPYNLPRIFLYLAVAIGLYFLSEFLIPISGVLKYLIHAAIFIGFLTFAYILEKPGKLAT